MLRACHPLARILSLVIYRMQSWSWVHNSYWTSLPVICPLKENWHCWRTVNNGEFAPRPRDQWCIFARRQGCGLRLWNKMKTPGQVWAQSLLSLVQDAQTSRSASVVFRPTGTPDADSGVPPRPTSQNLRVDSRISISNKMLGGSSVPFWEPLHKLLVHKDWICFLLFWALFKRFYLKRTEKHKVKDPKTPLLPKINVCVYYI